jgi:hypothetical protein
VTDLVPLLGAVAGAVGAALTLARQMSENRASRATDTEHQQMMREAVRQAAEHGRLIVVVCPSCQGPRS